MSLIVRMLGLADVAAAIALFTAGFDWWPHRWVLTVAGILLLKGFLFFSDPVSKFDCILALYVALTLLVNVKLLSILFGIYLGIKGIYSLF